LFRRYCSYGVLVGAAYYVRRVMNQKHG